MELSHPGARGRLNWLGLLQEPDDLFFFMPVIALMVDRFHKFLFGTAVGADHCRAPSCGIGRRRPVQRW